MMRSAGGVGMAPQRRWQMTRLEYSFRPEAVDKLSPWEYGDAVHFSCARFTAYEDAMAECTFVADCEEALDVVFCGGAGSFGFDSDAAVDDKIDLVAGARAPVGYFGITPEGIGVGDEFLENPALEGVTVFRGAGYKQSAPLEATRDTRVEKVELRRLDGFAGMTFAPNRHFTCEKGVLENLEG